MTPRFIYTLFDINTITDTMTYTNTQSKEVETERLSSYLYTRQLKLEGNLVKPAIHHHQGLLIALVVSVPQCTLRLR
jgi:hypothetical protein